MAQIGSNPMGSGSAYPGGTSGIGAGGQGDSDKVVKDMASRPRAAGVLLGVLLGSSRR
jgi:hypothetical protein